MLAEMTRKILNAVDQFEKFADARMIERETGFAEFSCRGVARIAPFANIGDGGQPVQCLALKPQHLAHLTRGAAPAIGDHVGGHRGAMFSVARIDVLNDAFTFFAGR